MMGEYHSLSSVDVEGVFIGAGCNRIVNTVSWGPSEFVAFGVHNAVAIFKPQTAKILITLPGHKDVVNCVEWLPRSKDICKDCSSMEEQFLLSGSADGIIIMWACCVSQNRWRQVLQVPRSHEKGITCISGIMLSKVDGRFASSSSDGTVNIWEVGFPSQAGGDCNLSMLQTINAGTKAMVALALAELPGYNSNWILAMGGLDNKVHLYIGERKGKFVHSCELKGHQDWIRSLDFSMPMISEERMDILVASASQDKNIRIWKIALHGNLSEPQEVQSMKSISLKTYIEGPVFKLGTSVWQVSLESLLVGHEDWVYSVKWQPPLKHCTDDSNDCWVQPQSILSASMDRTMMIWRPDRKTGIWVNDVTVGELSHSALGFYGGLWSPKGDAILAHGYGGSFHLWKNVGLATEDWQPQLVPSGHSAAVLDLGWAKSNQFILSASHDQTTRIFAPWERNNDGKLELSWHEIARPQVHGHDINCVAIIKEEGNHRYVSGAEEKVGRVFEAPLSFLQTLRHTAWGNLGKQYGNSEDIQILGANMSALGLSQRPIYVHGPRKASVAPAQDYSDGMETIPDAVPVVLTEPPLEENLAWNTLWPESHKLYGHGNELFAMCCDHKGKIIATACKAQSANVAEIWLWQVGSWRAIGRLHSHALTITQMEFSHDDHFLLSVSRDRHFSVFRLEKDGTNEIKHELVARHDAHKRIIWSCSWHPRGYVFATGSRDKTVKIWKMEKTRQDETCIVETMVLPQFRSSVTAVSWSPNTTFKDDVLAVGMENGLINIWRVSLQDMTHARQDLRPLQIYDSMKASKMLEIDICLCHAATVQRMVWKETSKNENDELVYSSSPAVLQLASCGADHTVRIFNVLLA